MAHVSHVTNCMVIVEMTSTLSQCDAVLPVLQLISLTSCFNPLQILSVDNEIQFHQLHHLNESYELKGPPSSQLYRTVSNSNDMQFHHLNDLNDLNESYQLKAPPFSQLYRTVSKSNEWYAISPLDFTSCTTRTTRTSWMEPFLKQRSNSKCL